MDNQTSLKNNSAEEYKENHGKDAIKKLKPNEAKNIVQQKSIEIEIEKQKNPILDIKSFKMQHGANFVASQNMMTHTGYNTALSIIAARKGVIAKLRENLVVVAEKLTMNDFFFEDGSGLNLQSLSDIISETLNSRDPILQAYCPKDSYFSAFCKILNPQGLIQESYGDNYIVQFFLKQLSLRNKAAWRFLENVLTGGTNWSRDTFKFQNCKISYIVVQKKLALWEGNSLKNKVTVFVAGFDLAKIESFLKNEQIANVKEYMVINLELKKCYVFLWYNSKTNKLLELPQPQGSLTPQEETLLAFGAFSINNPLIIKALAESAPQGQKPFPKQVIAIKINSPMFSLIAQYPGKYSKFQPSYQAIHFDVPQSNHVVEKQVYLGTNVVVQDKLDKFKSLGWKDDHHENFKQESFQFYTLKKKMEIFQEMKKQNVTRDFGEKTPVYYYNGLQVKVEKLKGSGVRESMEDSWGALKQVYESLDQQSQHLINLNLYETQGRNIGWQQPNQQMFPLIQSLTLPMTDNWIMSTIYLSFIPTLYAQIPQIERSLTNYKDMQQILQQLSEEVQQDQKLHSIELVLSAYQKIKMDAQDKYHEK